jgi:hypothetical protein
MSDYVSAVAKRAKVPVDEAREILARHRVTAYSPRGRGERIVLTRLWFAGVKDPDSGEKPFEFEWHMREGVQAVASAGNSAGKTSVLEICRWMLTGRDRHTVGGLDPRVRAMLHRVRLEFRIGDDEASVEVDARAGEGHGTLSVGRSQLPFTSETMEDVLGALLLDRLRLQSTSQFQRGAGSVRGSVTEHGWPLLSGALLVAPTHLGAVLGTVPNEAGRVLQVYMALPWYETLAQARSAHTFAKQAADDRRRAASAEDDVRGRETGSLRAKLEASSRELSTLGTDVDLVRQIEASVREAAEVGRALVATEQRASEAAVEAERAESAFNLARRELASAQEHDKASVYFRALQPRCCPRCAGPIASDRLEAEAQGNRCSVCVREHKPENDEQGIVEAEATVKRAEGALDAARGLRAHHENKVLELRESQARLGQNLEYLSTKRDAGQRQMKLLEVERLRGRLQEREETATVASTTASELPEIEILAAAEKEAETRVKENDELMDALNVRLLELGKRFGVSELTYVKLDRAAHLPVRKGGTPYPFTRLSDGDKLRLKVAVVIALLQLAGERGMGHHPGLLFVDSPGAQEVGAEPLEEMLGALRELAEHHQIQVIIATARRDEAVVCLGADRVRMPREDGKTLW